MTMSDEYLPDEIKNEHGDLDTCKVLGCEDHVHFGVKRHHFKWLENCLDDDAPKQLAVPYMEETVTSYSVVLVAHIGEGPYQFTFDILAENMQMAYMKAYTYWTNACHHMDTAAHIRMGINIDTENGGFRGPIHYSDAFPTIKYNEPMMITISNPQFVGVVASDVEKVNGQKVQDSLAKAFQDYMEEIHGEEE